MNKQEKEQTFEKALQQTLLEALEHEAVGEQLGPALVARMQTLARGILLQNGMGAAEVKMTTDKMGVRVHIRLPRKGPRVGVIRLQIGVH